VAVEQTALSVEADGVQLHDGEYTSTHPRLVLRLAAGSGVDLAEASVTIDGKNQTAGALVAGGNATNGAVASGVAIPVGELPEGPHELRARLYDAGHTVVGIAQLSFIAAARLRIESARITPNPVAGPGHVVFTLTRPAPFNFRLFDVVGREVYRQNDVGVPAENKVRLTWGSNRPAPGVYFFVLEAAYRDQRSSVRGRAVLVR
jgi:hypothetical protein